VTRQSDRRQLGAELHRVFAPSTGKLRSGSQAEAGETAAEYAPGSVTEDNQDGTFASLLYGFSILHGMTTWLAEGGEGLGTLGPPERVQLAGKSGLRRCAGSFTNSLADPP
jgi:hypothetical protein